MTWQNKFNGYESTPNVDDRLRGLNAPKVGPAEFQTVAIYRFNRNPQDADLMQAQARGVIEERIVPEEVYPAVIAVAYS